MYYKYSVRLLTSWHSKEWGFYNLGVCMRMYDTIVLMGYNKFMSKFTAIRLPQSSPNDEYAIIGEWAKAAGDPVNVGEVICLAETTKSVFEIEATAAGYLIPMVELGRETQIGAIVAVISMEPATLEEATAWLDEQEKSANKPVANKPSTSWTAKAALVAQRNDIDINLVPASGDKVTEADVLAYLEQASASDAEPDKQMVNDFVTDRYPSNGVQRLLILGAGNGSVQIIDALHKLPHQQAVAIMDDDSSRHGKQVAGVPIVGNIDLAQAQAMLTDGKFDAAIISISTNIPFRAKLFDEWHSAAIPFANVIHPSAVVGMNVRWGVGNVVMALCHFGACATIGNNNFLSAYCSLEHHSVLGHHSCFGPSVITSSSVVIGDRVRFGTGIFMEPRVQIGNDAVIASGCALWEKVPANAILKSKRGYIMRK